MNILNFPLDQLGLNPTFLSPAANRPTKRLLEPGFAGRQIFVGSFRLRIPINPTRRSEIIRPGIGAKRRRSSISTILVGLRQTEGLCEFLPH